MPFLFVDYDQGAGGEYFCANLSRSMQCNTIESKKFNTNRTKIIDKFDQEFLKSVPIPKIIKSDPVFYDVIPSHRNVHLAEQLLGKVYSIRISNPDDIDLWHYLKHQQIHKVLLSPLPSDSHFIGELKMLLRETPDTGWLKHLNRRTDGLSLILLSKGIEPTVENKNKYILNIISHKEPEPTQKYDLIIPYEHLFYNTDKIIKDLKDIFNIDINDNWLDQYKKDYDVYCSTT